MNAEGSVITSEDSAITSEGSALKKDDYVKERENSEGNTCLSARLADWGEIVFLVIDWHWDTVFFEEATHIFSASVDQIFYLCHFKYVLITFIAFRHPPFFLSMIMLT